MVGHTSDPAPPRARLTSMTATASERVTRLTPRSASEVADIVRTAYQEQAPLRVAGAGTWLQAGGPVEATRLLDVSGLAGITEYVPGDLTLTAQAGTTLEEIARATAEHGQWLPLDPFGTPAGTLGATLATASAGPVGGSIGLPRDVTVGLSYVSGTGDIVRAGGRVVKNVAGFDLVRLTIGAWGTLGVITEATVRLRARPDVDETVAIVLPDEQDALATLLSMVRAAAVEPLAAELVGAAWAERAGLGRRGLLLVRLAGNSVGVLHQRTILERLAKCEPVPTDLWSRVQQSDPDDGCIVRLSRRPSELARLWSTAMSLADTDAHATLARGIVRVHLPDANFMSSDAHDHVIIERAPGAWRVVTANDSLSRRLRDAFDPARILNRGIFGSEAG